MNEARVRIAAATLPGLDGLDVDALALPLGAERGQPRGVAGLIDWRLGGALARLVRNHRFEGRPGEQLLTLGGGGLGIERIFLFGPFLDGCRMALSALVEAGANRVALAPTPARPPVLEALAWLEALGSSLSPLDEVVLLDVDRALEASREEVASAATRAGYVLAPRGAT